MATIAESDDEAKSDMTPMIDVVFLMIVFFVCIEFKTLESRLDAWLPTDRGTSRQVAQIVEQLPVRVHVAEAGERDYGKAGPGVDVATGRPTRYALRGRRVRYEVGPLPCNDLTTCRDELRRVAESPQSLVPVPDTGGRRLMACVIEGMPGTCYDDIARVADACRDAGFVDVQFGGGMR